MSEEIYLSIVVPCYKEEKRLKKIIGAIKAYKKTKNFAIETVIVVDGSPDKTTDVARELTAEMDNVNIIDRQENRGKGYSVKEGVLAARGRYILFADADNSTPLQQVNKLLKFTDGYDVVIGSRYCKDGRLAHPQPIHRIIGSRVLNIIIQLLAARGIKDTQCGFKLFERNAAQQIFSKQTFDRFSFDIELLAIARKLGYRVKEAGITWYDDPHSTVNPIKDGLAMIRDAWQVRKNILAGKYKK